MLGWARTNAIGQLMYTTVPVLYLAILQRTLYTWSPSDRSLSLPKSSRTFREPCGARANVVLCGKSPLVCRSCEFR